jgi:hypothetical protein
MGDAHRVHESVDRLSKRALPLPTGRIEPPILSPVHAGRRFWRALRVSRTSSRRRVCSCPSATCMRVETFPRDWEERCTNIVTAVPAVVMADVRFADDPLCSACQSCAGRHRDVTARAGVQLADSRTAPLPPPPPSRREHNGQWQQSAPVAKRRLVKMRMHGVAPLMTVTRCRGGKLCSCPVTAHHPSRRIKPQPA